MLDVNNQIITTLKSATSLNVYYELIENPYTLPCITYQAYDNADTLVGDNISYSTVGYYIKLWAKSMESLMTYMPQIDEAMKSIGYQRESYNEMAIGNEICAISQYRALGIERN